MTILRQHLELPIITTTETIEGVRYTLREPRLFGAAANWGQVEDRGSTMLISAEISAQELAKIPVQHRRGEPEDITIEVERRRRAEDQKRERERQRGKL